jgi:hypothetical protein
MKSTGALLAPEAFVIFWQNLQIRDLHFATLTNFSENLLIFAGFNNHIPHSDAFLAEFALISLPAIKSN